MWNFAYKVNVKVDLNWGQTFVMYNVDGLYE